MKPVYAWTTHEEAAREEGRHWRSVSVDERVAAVEVIRRATVGIYDKLPARLERVHSLTVVSRRPVSDRRRSRTRR